MILKIGMKHQGEELYKVYINHDPGAIYICMNLNATKCTLLLVESIKKRKNHVIYVLEIPLYL